MSRLAFGGVIATMGAVGVTVAVFAGTSSKPPRQVLPPRLTGDWTYHTYTHAEAVAIDQANSRNSHHPICPKTGAVPANAPACVASVEGVTEGEMTPKGYRDLQKYGAAALGLYGGGMMTALKRH
jgi:hypothetical protein